MKIVALGPISPYRGGIVIYHTLLINKLSESNEVLPLSFSHLYPAWLYPGRTDKDFTQTPLPYPVEYLLDSLNPFSWLKTAKWIKKQQPDLLLIEWWITFLSPAYSVITRLCHKWGIHVLYVIHNVMPHEGGPVHRPLARFALKQADFYLTHAKSQQEALLKLIPGAQAKTCPLPVYSKGDRITPEDRTLARQQWELPLDGKALLFFGIVRAYKGLTVLIEAVGLLHQDGMPVYLIVAGEFWESKDVYVNTIERLGLKSFVQLIDRYIPDPEVRMCFAAADLVVAPYVGGTQSGLVSLAQGYGIPLVMTDRSAAGLDPMQLDPKTIVPAGDARALADAIAYQLSQPTTPAMFEPLDADKGWQQIINVIESFLPK